MADDKKPASSLKQYATAKFEDGFGLMSMGSITEIHVGMEKGKGKILAIEGDGPHLVVTHSFTYLPRGSKVGSPLSEATQTTRVPWARVKFVQDKHIEAK